jgi:hypothetical protein
MKCEGTSVYLGTGKIHYLESYTYLSTLNDLPNNVSPSSIGTNITNVLPTIPTLLR